MPRFPSSKRHASAPLPRKTRSTRPVSKVMRISSDPSSGGESRMMSVPPRCMSSACNPRSTCRIAALSARCAEAAPRSASIAPLARSPDSLPADPVEADRVSARASDRDDGSATAARSAALVVSLAGAAPTVSDSCDAAIISSAIVRREFAGVTGVPGAGARVSRGSGETARSSGSFVSKAADSLRSLRSTGSVRSAESRRSGESGRPLGAARPSSAAARVGAFELGW